MRHSVRPFCSLPMPDMTVIGIDRQERQTAKALWAENVNRWPACYKKAEASARKNCQ